MRSAIRLLKSQWVFQGLGSSKSCPDSTPRAISLFGPRVPVAGYHHSTAVCLRPLPETCRAFSLLPTTRQAVNARCQLAMSQQRSYHVGVAGFAPEEKAVPIVDFDYVKKMSDADSSNIVDVRDPSELQTEGKIPMTVNIPLQLVSEAFALPPKTLSARYGLEVNSHDDEIIFHCRSGKRSEQACILARNAGYRNVKNYKGSMLDWAEKTKNSNN